MWPFFVCFLTRPQNNEFKEHLCYSIYCYCFVVEYCHCIDILGFLFVLVCCFGGVVFCFFVVFFFAYYEYYTYLCFVYMLSFHFSYVLLAAMVLILKFRSLIHLCMWYIVGIQFHSLICGYLVEQIVIVTKTNNNVFITWHPCQKQTETHTHDHKYG